MKIFIIATTLLMSISFANCKKEKDDTSKNALPLLLYNSTTGSSSTVRDATLYTGLATIPQSLYSNPSTVNSSLSSRVIVNSDNKYVNTGNIYQPARDGLKALRTIVTDISALILQLKSLEAKLVASGKTLPFTYTASTENKWNNQSAKYSLKNADSKILSGGKHFEVWYNTSTSPYNSLKAAELIFKDDSNKGGDISGKYWGRFLTNLNTLGILSVDFVYNAKTSERSMKLVVEGLPDDVTQTATAKVHLFVTEKNNIVTLDGSHTVTIKEGLNNSVSLRSYTYTGAGTATRAAIKIAIPLQSSTDTKVYDNGSIANISEVWADWVLYSLYTSGKLTVLNKLTSLNGCSSLTSPSTPNPTANEGSSASELKTCIGSILEKDPNNDAKNIYYYTDLQNPAYYKYESGKATLYAIGDLPDDSFKEVNSALLSSVRITSNADYSADFTAKTISSISILNGTGIPASAQWGDGSTGVNSTNGSSNNSASF